MDYKVKAVRHDGAIASKSRARITSSSSHKTMAEHQANPDFAGGVWAVVDVPVHRTASGAGPH
jgi:hypothetical protein